jgi:nitric oxide reductase NorD protein
MGRIEFEPWEPEETIGKLWHSLASRLDAPLAHDEAAVDLSEVAGRLAVLFRGLGGGASVELRPVSPEVSRHRLGWRRRLGPEAETLPRTSFDGEVLRLPDRLAVYPVREANAALYVWLAAVSANARTQIEESDPLRADLSTLDAAREMVIRTLENAPGLRPLYEELCKGLLHQRTVPNLPPIEMAMEELIRHMLGDPRPLSELAKRLDTDVSAPRGYQPFRPVPLWPELRAVAFSDAHEVENRETEGPPEDSGEKTHRARRRKSDQAARSDSFILHKFEAILSWTEFLNLNRRVDDDDPDNAKKAADDQDEIGLFGRASTCPIM